MMGSMDSNRDMNQNPGLYLLAAQDIIGTLTQFPQLYLSISFYEIYGTKLLDLLNEKKEVKCLEDDKQKINIRGLSEIAVHSAHEIMDIIESGLEQRSSGATGANDYSSRSHAILQMELKRRENNETHARMSFIDLAGSERGADTVDNNK
jgi:kinesin family protein 2/24